MAAYAVTLTEEGRKAVGIHNGYGTFYVDADDVHITPTGALQFVDEMTHVNPPCEHTVYVIAAGLWLVVERTGTQGQDRE